ncbi:MAG TPA: hypothetical protein VJ792_06525 [Candidatus Nitrosotalea sp.]|nr:hypothetical protein [Candidatus Nitrosotalea sp.]
MVRLVPAFAIVFLTILSVYPALADSGLITVVAGKTYQVTYNSNGVRVQDIQTNPTYDELTAAVQVSSPNGYLDLTIPRALLDSKQGSNDIPFIVVIDGTLGNVEEKNATPESRTITIQLSPENKEIEIIGTYVAVSGPTGGISQAPQTVGNQPSASQVVANQSSIQTTQTPSGKPVTPSQPQPTAPSSPALTPMSQTNATQNIILRIPYVPGFVMSLSYIDLGVIGAIVLVIIIVIASSARRTSRIARRSA